MADDGASITLDGFDQMFAELRALPDVMQKRVMKGAVATGASVIRKEAIARAPEWDGQVGKNHPPTGTLKKAIYQTRLPEFCTSTVETWKVDVRTGKRTTKKGTALPDAYYASWVEFGHYTRMPKGTTKIAKAAARALGVARWVPADPFMRPAFETKKQDAVEAMRDYVNERLPEATAAMKFINALGK